jgi:hypothetical protein
VTSLPRVRKCGRVPRTAAGVGIRLTAEGNAGFAGLCSCGSVWSCPVHAAKIGAERAREEIAPVIRYTLDRGGSVIHAAFTVQHTAGIPLVKTFSAVQDAWSFMGSHRRWRGMDADYGVIGWTRGAEATWGRAHGWHPHLHVLIYLDSKIDEMEALRLGAELYDVYRRGLERSGYTCSPVRGVRVRLATNRRDAEGMLSTYVSKLAQEITRQDRKTGRAGRFTPFELLSEALDQGDADAMDRWHEWEQATYGRKQLTWSGRRKDRPDVRTLAGLREERTDEEIASDDLAGDQVLTVPNDAWPDAFPVRTALLDAAEEAFHAARDAGADAAGAWSAGAAAARAWLDSRGIDHHPPPPPSVPYRMSRESERLILRRSARMVLRC